MLCECETKKTNKQYSYNMCKICKVNYGQHKHILIIISILDIRERGTKVTKKVQRVHIAYRKMQN